MTPLDHLRLWFVGLDSDVQFDVAYSLSGALIEDWRGRRLRSQRDFIAAVEAWLAPGGFPPRHVGKALSFAAVLEHVYEEAEDPERRTVWERIEPEWRRLRARHLNRETNGGMVGGRDGRTSQGPAGTGGALSRKAGRYAA